MLDLASQRHHEREKGDSSPNVTSSILRLRSPSSIRHDGRLRTVRKFDNKRRGLEPLLRILHKLCQDPSIAASATLVQD